MVRERQIWYHFGILNHRNMSNVKHGEPVMDGRQHHGKAPSDRRFIAALSYFGLLCLVPLVFARDSAFAQEHARQGLLLALIALAVKTFAQGIWRVPFGGLFITILGFALFVTSIIGIIKAARGERFEIPYISDWSRKLSKKFGM